MRGEIHEAAVIEACAARRCAVTPDQLKRWRRCGLLPRPRQEHVRGLRGSQSWYPAEVVDQVVLIEALLRNRRRSLDDVRLELWRRGMWADRALVRKALVTPLSRMAQDWAALLFEAGGEPAEAADLAMQRFGFRDPSATTKLMWQRLGASRSGAIDMRNVVWFFFLHGFGADQDGVDSELGSVLEVAVAVATGVAQAREDDISGAGTWLPATTSATGFVVELRDAGAFDIPRMAETIASTTDAHLDRALADVLLFIDLATIATGIEAMFGTDIAGVGSLRALRTDAMDYLPFIINTMLVLRRVLGDEPFEQVERLIGDERDRYSAIVTIEEAIPGAAAILVADGRGIVDTPDGEREALRIRLAALFEQRPELEQQLQ
jgi:hypothetical protein